MRNSWFLSDDVPLAMCVPYHHDAWLVVVSYLVAAFAAYTAFHLIARVRAAAGFTARCIWLVTAGISMGFGIWAMHFIATLAVDIPLAIRFNLPITVLSALFAAIASAAAFHFVANNGDSRVRLALAGLVLGSGIGLMHYVGMAALRLPAHIYYDPWLFALSVVVAVVFSTAALFALTALPRLSEGRMPLARIIGAAVMGLAIVLMHYTGMFATYFYPEAVTQETGTLFDPPVMAAAVTVTTLLIAGLALVAALFDRRAEQAEALLRDAVNSISEGFVIYDRDDRLVMCNEGYRRLYRDSADVMIPGTRFEDILRAGLARGQYADARGREEDWLQERLCLHREAQGAIEQQLGDGTWVLITDRKMSNGSIAGLRINITAMKTAQAALRDSEARLDRAQEMAGIGSWEIDTRTERVVWSKQVYRIRGLTPEQFGHTTQALQDVIHPDDRSKVRAWLDHLKTGAPHPVIEYRIMRPDGQIRIVSCEGQGVADETGAVTKLAGTVQDITDKRRTEQQLFQAQKMETVGQLTGGLAHDFNNILGAVIGNLDLAQENSAPDSPAANYCQLALDAALSGAELVKRMLAFARRQALHPRPTQLDDAIANVLPLLRRTLGEHIRIETQLDSHLWPAIADTVQLESAILNLVVNARDAMPQGGTLSIEAANVVIDPGLTTASGEIGAGDYVVISVTDTGVGMPPEHLAQAFEPFFTTKEPGSGSGLGLSMVLGTIQQLGGGVQIHSRVGIGTTVRLYLPRAHVVAEVAEEQKRKPESLPRGSEHILLVEDNEQISEIAAEMLGSLGYQVTVVANGDDAMWQIENGIQFDMLFTDIVMPGRVNGIALAQTVRQRDPNVRILFTSGFANPETLREQVDTIGAELIHKPYRKAELAVLIRSLLNKVPERAG